MKLLACRYVVVQFAPYRETGEFANAGVVLMCPETGYFDFKLQTRRTKRITDFFDELPRDFYLRAVKAMSSELERVGQLVADVPSTGSADQLRHLFDSLIHPREAMVRFSAPRAVMTTDPAAELIKQFDHQVERTFATPEYVEQVMERRIKALLSGLQLAAPFVPLRVGNDEFHARFQLVQEEDGVQTKIIKPFHLNQAETVGIYEHGDAWLQKIKRLRDRKLLPDAVLFAVKAPALADSKRYAAYSEICSDLHRLAVRTVDENAEQQITDFALS